MFILIFIDDNDNHIYHSLFLCFDSGEDHDDQVNHDDYYNHDGHDYHYHHHHHP